MASATENMKLAFEQIRDERMMHANTATRVGNAFLMLLNYITGKDVPFLRKDQTDSTRYLLKLLAGAVIGESGDIRLNADGSIVCNSMTVRGSAVFSELVFNHQNVLDGDTYFTEKGIIDSVDFIGDGQYKLLIRKEYDDEIVSFHAYDVLKCSMNNLDRGRTYKTSWMRVDSVDTDENAITVTLYDNEDVPGGVNYAPLPAARLIRWGNQLDKDRQGVFFVSSKDNRFMFLQGVTQPKLTDGNYSAFIGVPPDLDCLKNIPLAARQPYIYARGLIVQDIIKLDYKGNPQFTERDLGTWQADKQYIHGYDDEAKGWFTDRVWWGGCYWQCSVEKATVGKEPRYNNADWACLLGGANMSLELYSSKGDFFPSDERWQTTIIAELWNAEMKITEEEIGRENIKWTRISEDTAGDAAWGLKHAQGTVGLELLIDSSEDIGTWTAGKKVGFQCEIFIGEQNMTYTSSYEINI